MNNSITPFLWFDNNASEAMNFYCGIFKNSKKIYDTPMSVVFELNGQKFYGLNGGPMYKFNESISFFIDCGSQEEVDYYWEKLTADGGSPGRCGWLKDKFGLSWQVIPKILGQYLSDSDREKANKVMQAMMQMEKIDVEKLNQAYTS